MKHNTTILITMLLAGGGLISAAAAAEAPTADFVWNSPVTGNWSDAAKWTNGQSTGVAPAAAGRADYAFGFNQAGTYTATHDLNAGFLLNKLVFNGATLTLEGSSGMATSRSPSKHRSA